MGVGAVPNELTLMSGQRVSVPAELAAKLRRAADAVIDRDAPPGKSP